jgi:hypothetical protein
MPGTSRLPVSLLEGLGHVKNVRRLPVGQILTLDL